MRHLTSQPEYWTQRFTKHPELAGWYIDEIHTGKTAAVDAGRLPPFCAIAQKMNVAPETVDWLNLDPYEVVLAFLPKNRRSTHTWEGFEDARVDNPNPRFPNRHTKPNDPTQSLDL